MAWAAALVVYADLTCVELAPANPQPARRVARAAAGATSKGGGGRSRSGSAASAPANLGRVRSIAEAIDRPQSVSGFVRRLPDGQAASSEATAAAQAVGIRIPPGCTWVRPHVRSTEVLHVALTSRRLW
jgi:hypothetical protein